MECLVVTHMYYRKNKPAAGPFTTVERALRENGHSVTVLGVPLVGFDDPVYFASKNIKIPTFLGKVLPIKFLADMVVIKILTLVYLIKNLDKQVFLISIDPLSTLPLIALRYIFGAKLVFYSVDYSQKRFGKGLLQLAYEWANKISALLSNQTWVVSEYLQSFMQQNYGIKPVYMPNSFSFNKTYFDKNISARTGNKVVWTGSILTDKQIVDIVKVSKHLQSIRPELTFWYIPSNKLDLFEKEIKAQELRNVSILDVTGQEASRELVSQCDLGLAIYDKDFGSTKYIEPIKTWEYMLCGIPFIISNEPSISNDIKKGGVVLFLEPDNSFPDTKTLNQFIAKDNLSKLHYTCIEIGKRFDATKVIGDALSKLTNQ